MKFEVAEDVQEGGKKLKIKVSGTPKPDAIQGGTLDLQIPSDKVTTNITTKLPVEMESSTYDIQDPLAHLQDPLEIFGVQGTEIDASSVIRASNFTFKKIAPSTDISSWVKFQTGVDAEGNIKYVYANELDTDKNKDAYGKWIIPKGLKYEVDEAGTAEGEDTIGIRVYGTPDGEANSNVVRIDMPTNVISRANPYNPRVFPVTGSNMETSGMIVSNVLPTLNNPEAIIGTAYFPLSKDYDFTIVLNFTDKNGKYPTFTGLAVGDDISSWFSDTIKGEGKNSINYKVKEIKNQDGTTQSTMTFTISGTPTEFNDLKPTIMIPRANIAELKEETTLPESFVVVELSNSVLKYQIAEYPASTAFSAKSIVSGTVGVPYQMDKTVKFNAVDDEVPFKYDDRQVRSILLKDGLEFNKAFNAGDDITTWFTNAPSGVTFTVFANTKQYDKTLQVYVGGTPESMSKEEITYTIPSDVLSFSGTVNAGTAAEKVYSHMAYVPTDGATVASENRSAYAIYGISLENPSRLFVRGPASSEIDTVTATVKFTDNLRFKVSRNAGFDISSWFKNVWASTQEGKSDKFKYTLASDISIGSNSFTFTISGLQGENGMRGAALLAISIPSNLLQDNTGATISDSGSYKVAVSSSYSDIAEEYARIYLATPKLKIVSEDRDFYAVRLFPKEFEVVYQLEDGEFNLDKIKTDQPYYSWANYSLLANENLVSSENYRNRWTLYNEFHEKDVEMYVKEEVQDGIVDVGKGLGVKVLNVSSQIIVVKYYGMYCIAWDYLNPEELYLNIPSEYIVGSPVDGVTSTDAITIYYEEPTLSFAPYGFYANDEIRKEEIAKLEEKVEGRAYSPTSVYDMSYRFAGLSYDLAGVVGQPLSEYSYDIANNYESKKRTEEYHYYAFSPLNFNVDVNIGDNVSYFFFNGKNEYISNWYGITWTVIDKVKNVYKNLTIDLMNSSLDGTNKLLDRDVDEGYIYIVKAEGSPKVWTDYPLSADKTDFESAPIQVNIPYNVNFSKYKVSASIYASGSSHNDNGRIKSSLAPSYALTQDMTKYSNSGLSLNPPVYKIFSIFVPFSNWYYSVSTNFPYVSSVEGIFGKNNYLLNASNGNGLYNASTEVNIDKNYIIKTNMIPILINGNVGITKNLYDIIWNQEFYRSNPDKFYVFKPTTASNGEKKTWAEDTITLTDPRVDHTDGKDYYWDLPFAYYDSNHSEGALLAGGSDFANIPISTTKIYNKSSNNAEMQAMNYIFEKKDYDDNRIIYIGFRPKYTYKTPYGSYLFQIYKTDFLKQFELWIRTNQFHYPRKSTSLIKNIFGNPVYAEVGEIKGNPSLYYDNTVDYDALSPEYDLSLPRWLKVTPSDPYSKNYVIPGIISAGETNYKATVEKTIDIKAGVGINVSQDIVLTLLNARYVDNIASQDVSS